MEVYEVNEKFKVGKKVREPNIGLDLRRVGRTF